MPIESTGSASSKPRSLLWLALFGGATAVTSSLGAWAPHRGRSAWYRLMAPYLGWLGYAGWLNAGIVRRNPRLAG